jgi:hypothetical protein
MFDPCRLAGRLFYLLFSLLLAFGVARAVPPPVTTTIADTIYRADGSPASGTLLITWPQFTTSDNKAVASGTMNVIIGAGGAVSIALAPNVGAMPAGSFYKVTYKLDDAVANKNVVDVDKFRDGLGKIIDGVVQCLNASVWAKTS